MSSYVTRLCLHDNTYLCLVIWCAMFEHLFLITSWSLPVLRLYSVASFFSSFGKKTVLCKLQLYFSKRNSIAYDFGGHECICVENMPGCF